MDKRILKQAFEAGEQYDYRCTKNPSFNRWYNQNCIGMTDSKCKVCAYAPQKYYSVCKNCVDCKSFKPSL